MTGVVVAGFGGGAALVGRLAASGFAMGFSPDNLFVCFGAFFLLIVPLTSLAMRLPGSGAEPIPMPVDAITVLGSRTFLTLFLTFGAGLAAGLTVNSNLKQLNPDEAGVYGVWTITCFALCNAGGRIAWGELFDRCAPTVALGFNLLLTALVLGLSFWLFESFPGVLVFAGLSGFNYGGLPAMYPAFVARVDESICSACFHCERVCPYGAVMHHEIRNRKGDLIKIVARVNEGVCQGCGTCQATCPSKSVEFEGFRDTQIWAAINALQF